MCSTEYQEYTHIVRKDKKKSQKEKKSEWTMKLNNKPLSFASVQNVSREGI